MSNTRTTEELVIEYQQGNQDAFNQVVENMDKMIRSMANRGVRGMSFDDVHAELLISLWKCCQQYNGSAKLSTMFYTYASNKLRELRTLMSNDIRKANVEANSFNQMQDDTGFDLALVDEGFDEVEVRDMVKRSELTDKEKTYLELKMDGTYETKKQIAMKMGVDPSAINYFQKSIAKKLLNIAI